MSSAEINKYRLSEKDAYGLAHEDLIRAVHRPPYVLGNLFPGRFFFYGEGGYGLLLDEGIVWISSESAEDIRGIKGEFTIGREGYLDNPQWEDLKGRIPNEKIDKVMGFVSQVVREVGRKRQQLEPKATQTKRRYPRRSRGPINPKR